MSVPEAVALETKDQAKYSRKIRRLKKKVKSGKISIKELVKEKKLKAEQTRGLIYVGHLPHGFYENEIRAYFKQFGVVTNVKVCRSRKTGNSKGYGFVEFSHPEVAKIAAETMDNYLMFKKRVIAKLVPFEKRPKALFFGKQSTLVNYAAKRRQARFVQMKNKQIDDEVYVEQGKQALKKFQKKMKKLQEFGINYSLEPVDIPENEKLVKHTLEDSQIPEFSDSDIEINIKQTRPKVTETPKKILKKPVKHIKRVKMSEKSNKKAKAKK